MCLRNARVLRKYFPTYKSYSWFGSKVSRRQFFDAACTIVNLIYWPNPRAFLHPAKNIAARNPSKNDMRKLTFIIYRKRGTMESNPNCWKVPWRDGISLAYQVVDTSHPGRQEHSGRFCACSRLRKLYSIFFSTSRKTETGKKKKKN